MTIVLTLGVETADGPIHGTVTTADGAVGRPFRGWLDLATALESVIAEARTGEDGTDVGTSLR